MARRNRRGFRVDATGRSAGGGERFILLPHFMLNCPAWKTLSPNAKALLLDVWTRHNGMNNGEIGYSVREAEEIGLSKDQAGRAFKELVERGFLKVRRSSAFTLRTKEARTWELTGERFGDNPATKDFMWWGARSPQRDREATRKNKTQSHQRDRQRRKRPFLGLTSATLIIYHTQAREPDVPPRVFLPKACWLGGVLHRLPSVTPTSSTLRT